MWNMQSLQKKDWVASIGKYRCCLEVHHKDDEAEQK